MHNRNSSLFIQASLWCFFSFGGILLIQYLKGKYNINQLKLWLLASLGPKNYSLCFHCKKPQKHSKEGIKYNKSVEERLKKIAKHKKEILTQDLTLYT